MKAMRNLMLIIMVIVAHFHVEAKKIKGVIILNNQSREVTFDIKVPLLNDEPSFERLQYKVRYYDENGKRQTLRPDGADEIRFNYNGTEIRMISCSTKLGDTNLYSSSGRIFLKLEIDGRLRLYRYYYTKSTGYYGTTGMGYSPGMTYTADNLIFQKGGGPLKQPRSIGWRKDMLDYFSDCPPLLDRIESKDLRKKEIEAIVLFYNKNCGEK